MKNLLYIILAFPIMATAQTPSQDQNYVLSTTYQKGFMKNSEGAAKDKDKILSIQYFDGLGRPIQNVAVKAGGQSQDIITFVNYDEFGRQTKEYLPYSAASNGGLYRVNGLNATANFYNSVKYEHTLNPYSEKHFEASPLNRTIEQAAPGNAWLLNKDTDTDHTIKFGYESNSATEVKIYTVSLVFANNTYTPTLQGGSSYYGAHELHKTITKDENWKAADGLNRTTEEFKNKQGRILLKRTYNVGVAHDTYYVYDDHGNLTYVLPPKAQPHYQKPDTTEMLELCYQYKYDNRNRLVEKKIPGKGWESIVYNRLDQPIMTQDAKLDAQNKWLFTKYDKLGRIAYTGFSNTGASRTSLQAAVNNSTQMWVSRGGAISLGGATSYYNNAAYPATVSEIHSFNYYDDYYFDKSGLIVPSKSYGIDIVNYNNANATKVLTRGLATGSKIKVLGQNGHWVTTINGYDDKSRPIWIGSYNSFLQTTDIIENKLDDFTGRVLETKTTHKKNGKADIVTIDTYTYDHQGRVLEQNQYINNNEGELIARNYYDELGQLEKKDVGGNVSNSTTSAITSTNYIDLVGVSVSGTEVTSTAGTGWNNSGFATAENFSGDGSVEYEIPQTGKYIMVGLSTDNTNAHYNTIDYAVYHYSTNRVYVYESGSYKGNFTTYQVGDRFKIERLGNTIYYKKNNVTFYTSTITSTGSLLGDVAFYQNEGKVKDLKIVSGIDSMYKDVVNATTSGPAITSTAGNGWNNSGFATKESFTHDGFIEYEMPQTNKSIMLGVSSTNANAHYNTIKYAIYNRGNGSLGVYESGSGISGVYATYQAGDIFRIERIGNTIYYKKNGVTFYTSAVSSTETLFGDVAFYTSGSKIKNFTIVDHDYIDLMGVELTNGIAKKTAGDSWGTGGFASKEKISGDGYVELEVLMPSTYSMFGLSPTNIDAHYNTIKHGIYLNHPSSFYVYEMGSNKGLFGSYQVGDVFRVERVGNTINYTKNGETFYTSTVLSSGALLGDVAIRNTSRLVKINMANTESQALQTVDYTYNVRGWLKNINDVSGFNDDLFNFKINYDDPSNGTALYNGNISQTMWKTKNTDQSLRTYTYAYDALNRITYAGDDNSQYKYALANVAYDKNGNINSLVRKGHTNSGASSFGVMDELTYIYGGKSNKLRKVIDAGNPDYGFKDGTNTTFEYTYDVNGNMVKDLNKGISNISYNHLNLPTQVTLNGQNISYVYDATGVKLRKIVNGTTTDYAGNYIYENNNLQFFSHPEGYVQNTNGEFSYVYQYKDHLGNVRMSYADSDKDGHITDAGLFSDDMENSSGWNSIGAMHGSSATIDTQRNVSGTKSAKLTLSGVGDFYAHSNEWIPIDNSTATDYIFSGWVYLQSTSSAYARILLFMNEDDETGYSTQVSDTEKVRTKGQWIYIEKQVTVPSTIDKLNLRIDVYTSYSSGATAWFDDVQIKKVGSSEIVAENNYYPFGLKHKGYNDATNPGGNSVANRYGYNGKELQDEVVGGTSLQWHDYGARNYDASLGRWFGIDPLADKMRNNSPYNYAFNNPILYVDPDGRFPILIHVRSFAPYKNFGAGLWHGDNRGFSRDPTVTSRLHQITNYETETGASRTQVRGSFSSSTYGAFAYSDASLKNYSSSNKINTHMYGNNHAILPPSHFSNYRAPDWGGPTWDIDIHTNLDIEVSNLEDGNQLLSITGRVGGDTFPNAEAFVSDTAGNSIWLGAFLTADEPTLGPFFTLAGDRNRTMIDVNIGIVTDKNGIFTGVRVGSKTISLKKWNKDSSGPLSVEEFKKKHRNFYDQLFGSNEED